MFEVNTINYPNLRAFMKRHGLTINDLSEAAKKSYPTIHQKLNRKSTDHGKVSLFDIEEARAIIKYVITTEQGYLRSKYGTGWEKEWSARWGHISNWFEYIFFDEMVTNVTKPA